MLISKSILIPQPKPNTLCLILIANVTKLITEIIGFPTV